MHELSVAISLIDVVMEHLITSGASAVRRVVVEVGELSGILPAALRTAFFTAAKQEPALVGATLEIIAVPVTLFCENCNSDQPAASVQAINCSACGLASANVVRGRELDVIAIEVVDAATDA